KKPDENVGFDPVAVSLEHGVPFAKKGGQIAPRAPRPDHPQHCFNEQPIVLAASTRVRRLAQTMRLHLRPLGVSQNESFHPKLESQTSFPWNPESQQTLERAAIDLERLRSTQQARWRSRCETRPSARFPLRPASSLTRPLFPMNRPYVGGNRKQRMPPILQKSRLDALLISVLRSALPATSLPVWPGRYLPL